MAVAGARRGHGVGRALVTEIARRARDAGRAFLALAPRDGDGAAGREAFFHARGLAPIEPEGQVRPGAVRLRGLAARGATMARGR